MKSRVIFFLAVLGVGLFVVTFFVTRAFRAEQNRLAGRWFERGSAALSDSQPALAATAFRNALLYDRDNEEYQFKLAKALSDSGKTDEAEAYFKNLWSSEPGNAVTNLELARLAVRKDDYGDAVRFFHGAIYGVWAGEPAIPRNKARLELIHFLLDREASEQADAELIALEAELPNTDTAHQNVADLLMKVHDYSRALDEYQRAAVLNHANTAALVGAGQASFALGRYPAAQEYLQHALALGTGDPAVTKLADTLDAVMSLDPYAQRITDRERRSRVLRAFEQAGTRLRQCAEEKAVANGGKATPSLTRSAGQSTAKSAGANATTAPAMTQAQKEYFDWQQLRPRITDRGLRRDPALTDTAMDLVFQIEWQAGLQCGALSTADTALQLIARQHGGK